MIANERRDLTVWNREVFAILTIAGAILVQTATIVWFASAINSKISNNEKNIAEIIKRNSRSDNEEEEHFVSKQEYQAHNTLCKERAESNIRQYEGVLRELTRVNDKLDALPSQMKLLFSSGNGNGNGNLRYGLNND